MNSCVGLWRIKLKWSPYLQMGLKIKEFFLKNILRIFLAYLIQPHFKPKIKFFPCVWFAIINLIFKLSFWMPFPTNPFHCTFVRTTFQILVSKMNHILRTVYFDLNPRSSLEMRFYYKFFIQCDINKALIFIFFSQQSQFLSMKFLYPVVL